jgi:hypothetical protein
MKFAALENNGQRRVGLLRPDAREICPICATDLAEVIAQFDALKPSLSSGMESMPLGEVRLLAPIPEARRNLFCVERNYRGNADPFLRVPFQVKDGHNFTPDRSGSGIARNEETFAKYLMTVISTPRSNASETFGVTTTTRPAGSKVDRHEARDSSPQWKPHRLPHSLRPGHLLAAG